MKCALIVGRTPEALSRMCEIISSGDWVCCHACDVVEAIRYLASKRFDAIIVSSKTLSEDRINLMDYIVEHFRKAKILVSLDNGADRFELLFGEIQFVTQEDSDLMALL